MGVCVLSDENGLVHVVLIILDVHMEGFFLTLGGNSVDNLNCEVFHTVILPF